LRAAGFRSGSGRHVGERAVGHDVAGWVENHGRAFIRRRADASNLAGERRVQQARFERHRGSPKRQIGR
jgi:hypothetical protein